MDQDYVRLGEELKAARERRRPRMTQPAAADALAVSRTTVQKMENGKADQVTPTTVRGYARLLGWSDDSVKRVLAGGDPIASDEQERMSADSAVLAPQALGLSPAVEYELRSSEVLDSQVINLGPDEDDGHIIVVLQGKKGATPEEVERIAARYRRARRHLQGLAADPDVVADP
ncbi:helix-turn-helix transcriptional regulator [Streptomyces brasiliscabiei]|uniref:Helix-turn-helix transcriptional regulator n=1 Tax=Streptomyces brasiliscabiei TaxID=2736302 RepID=A0ABU8GH39_9ACTN